MNDIKKARHDAGLTQQAMSDRLGIPRRSIEDWESEKHDPPLWAEKLIVESLVKIAKGIDDNKNKDTIYDIKTARLAAGLTQQAMSDRLGIPKRSIENWEGKKRKPAPWAEKLIIHKLLLIANGGDA